LTLVLPEDHATAKDAVAALEGNALTAGILSASLPRGSDGAGKLSPDDSVALLDVDPRLHTFNILALAAMGQNTGVFSRALQIWSFWLLFIGFAIKVPSVPVHTWLPDAHVEAPTPISMILAGVLLKMGGYGIIRICYPICPFGGYDGALIVCLIGVISMVYGAFAAMAQKDFKRLVAYSSVSHMGYVVLGLGVWSAVAGTGFNPDYWNMGVKGAMFQMIAHGISSSGMFFMVGVIYDRVHHRNLNEFGGLFGKMPVYTALAIGIFFAGLGLPGLCGFIGEVLVVLSVWQYSYALAVISAAVVILTAAYILWAIQRVYLGAEYKGPHEEELTEIKPRELGVAIPLFVLAIVLGVFPYQTVLRYMDGTIDRQTQQLADWTREVAVPADIEAAKAAAEEDGGEAGEPVATRNDQAPPAAVVVNAQLPEQSTKFEAPNPK
jgi:NADH-quinone oxidoreductase subunit M